MCPHPFVPMCVPIYEHVCPCTPNTQTQDIVLKLGVGGEGGGACGAQGTWRARGELVTESTVP